ncbi:hypothetical protein [Microbispora sp. NPDC049633]
MSKDTAPCCRNCGGRGSVVVRQADNRTGTYTLTTVTCPACSGTGTEAR